MGLSSLPVHLHRTSGIRLDRSALLQTAETSSIITDGLSSSCVGIWSCGAGGIHYLHVLSQRLCSRHKAWCLQALEEIQSHLQSALLGWLQM